MVTTDSVGKTLALSHAEWQAFLTGVRLGDYDLPEGDAS
jgi:Domain of unknown function (DUF397)